MDSKLAISASGDERPERLGGFFGQSAARGDHGDAHGQRLWLDRGGVGNGCADQRVCRFRAGCSFFAVLVGLAAWRSPATDFVFFAFSSFAFLTGFAAWRSFVTVLPFDGVAFASFAL